MWYQILEFIFTFLSKIGDFANWLFTRVTLADALVKYGEVIGGVIGSFKGDKTGYVATIVSTLRAFFQEEANGFSWTNNINFAPIDLISVGFLTALVVMGVIKVYSIFS